MRQGQEEGDCCFGVCRGMSEEGLMSTYCLMPPHTTGTGGEDFFVLGVCRGMPEEGLMFTYRLMPHMRQGQEERDFCLVCVGVCQSLGLMFTYRLMPLMRQGPEERDCCFGVCRGMPEEGEP